MPSASYFDTERVHFPSFCFTVDSQLVVATLLLCMPNCHIFLPWTCQLYPYDNLARARPNHSIRPLAIFYNLRRENAILLLMMRRGMYIELQLPVHGCSKQFSNLWCSHCCELGIWFGFEWDRGPWCRFATNSLLRLAIFTSVRVRLGVRVSKIFPILLTLTPKP